MASSIRAAPYESITGGRGRKELVIRRGHSQSPDDLLRDVAIAVLLGFGIALLVPPLPARLAGSDVEDGVATVDRQRLHRLVELPAGTSGYAFTFG